MNAETATAATVLIVDDEFPNREALQLLLESEGYATRCATSGRQALTSVEEHAPDLILLDVTMPDMDGFAVASALKSSPITASIPIIMITAHTGRGARVVGLNTGAEDYLTKPVDAAELSLKVRNLLRLKANTESLRERVAHFH